MSINMDKIALWSKIKEKLLTALDESPAFEVDLAFEYKDNKGRIVTYTSGELIYITDLKFSSGSKLMIEVPYGAESRFIPLEYADSISNPNIGSLDLFIDNLYEEIINDGSNILSFADTVESDEVDPLNNATQWIQETIEAERDKKSFQEIDKFGMF